MSTKTCIPIRNVIVLLCCLSTFVSYMTRNSLNMAIIAMVKSDGDTNNNHSSNHYCRETHENKNLTFINFSNKFNDSLSINYKNYYDIFKSDVTTESSSDSEGNTGEFTWTPSEQGLVLGSFAYGYVATQIVGGRLAEKYGAKWIIATSLAVSTVISFLQPTIARFSFVLLIVSRVVLGLAQSVIFPSCYAMASKWVPDSERSSRLALFTTGANVGTIVIMMVAGALCKTTFLGGWPSVFYTTSICCFAVFVIFAIIGSSEPSSNRFISDKELCFIQENLVFKPKDGDCQPECDDSRPVSWWKLLTSKEVMANVFAKLMGSWTSNLAQSKLPAYLSSVQDLPVDLNGYMNAIIMGSLTIAYVSAGFSAQFIIKYGLLSKTTTRKLFESVALFGSAVCLVLMTFVGCHQWLAITLLVMTTATYGLVTGGDIPNVTDLTTKYSGTVFALGNTSAAIPMFLAPYLAGLIINSNPASIHLWNYVFYLSALLNVLGGLIFLAFGSGEMQEHKWVKNQTT